MPIKRKEVKESEKEIRERLKGEKDVIIRARLQMLLIFKQEPTISYERVGKMLGYSGRQITRWWKRYEAEGIEGLMRRGKRGRRKGFGLKVPERAFEELKEEMREGRIRTIKDGIRWILENYGVQYSYPHMYRIFRIRLKAKKKTGRPYNIRKDKEKEEEFKKNAVWQLKGKK